MSETVSLLAVEVPVGEGGRGGREADIPFSIVSFWFFLLFIM